MKTTRTRARRELSSLLRALLFLLVAGLMLPGCPIKQRIEQVETGLHDAIVHLDDVVDGQRSKLTADTLAILAETTTRLGVLDEQVTMGVRGVEEKSAADLLRSVSIVVDEVDHLTLAVQGGVAQSVAQISLEIGRQIETTNAMLIGLVDNVRPLLAQATRSGDVLVARVTDEATVLLIRGVGGLFGAIALIGLIVVLVKKSGAGASLTMFVLFGAGVVAVVAARPIGEAFAAEELRFPDPDAACKTMSDKGPRLLATLKSAAKTMKLVQAPVSGFSVGGAYVSGADVRRALVGEAVLPRLLAPPIERPPVGRIPVLEPVSALESGAIARLLRPGGAAPSPVPPSAQGAGAPMRDAELSALIQGGAKRRIVDKEAAFRRTGGFTVAGESSQAEADTKKLAEEVRASALVCSTYTPTPSLAAEARQYLVVSNQYLGAPVVCTSSNQCAAGQKCDITTGECLAVGVYCEEAMHCDPGMECDRSLRRCVGSAAYRCSPGKECRTGEVCSPAGACKLAGEVVGQPCDVATAQGPCRAGRYVADGQAVKCQSVKQPAPEVCDSVDNDCNGMIDDGNPGGATSCASDTYVGECRYGLSACRGGQVECLPGPVKGEVCDDKDNDCDGMIDEESCPTQMETDTSGGCDGWFGCRSDTKFGGQCASGRVRLDCLVKKTSSGDGHCEMTSWGSSDPTDCSCNVHFGSQGGVHCTIQITSAKAAKPSR